MQCLPQGPCPLFSVIMLILTYLQGQDCFVCKRKGHLAKDCPDKNKKIVQESEICLRCGEVGHIMSSCPNDYSPDDLKVGSSSVPPPCVAFLKFQLWSS